MTILIFSFTYHSLPYTYNTLLDGVIIETTGLADPAPVVQTFFVDEDIQEMYSLDAVITVVDAKNILTRLAEEKPEVRANFLYTYWLLCICRYDTIF